MFDLLLPLTCSLFSLSFDVYFSAIWFTVFSCTFLVELALWKITPFHTFLFFSHVMNPEFVVHLVLYLCYFDDAHRSYGKCLMIWAVSCGAHFCVLNMVVHSVLTSLQALSLHSVIFTRNASQAVPISVLNVFCRNVYVCWFRMYFTENYSQIIQKFLHHATLWF